MAQSASDDTRTRLFGVETILPPQFWGDGGRDLRAEPAKRLMLAVLEDAISVLASAARRPTARLRRFATDVDIWMASNARSDPFAFATICDVLGLDPGAVRSAVRRWRGAGHAVYHRRHSGRGRQRLEVRPVRRRRTAAARDLRESASQ
jgi:hypothetical protein